MKSIKLIFTVILFSAVACLAGAKEIYVSPIGNDANNGTRKQPLQTLEKALSVINQSEDKEITVWLSGGVYPIEKPLVFINAGNRKLPAIIFKAVDSQKPVISGGVQLKNWTKNENGQWECRLPEKLFNIKNARELFIDGKRATRARFPDENYLRIKKAGTDKRTFFWFEKGDFPVPAKTGNVELVFLHDWSITRIEVREINTLENTLTTVDTIGTTSLDFFRMDGWEPNPRYFLENATEFLDVPFEWVFDKEERKFILLLPENDAPGEHEIFIPVADELMVIQGNESLSVSNIHFEGIDFRYCRWEIPEQGYCGIQACHFDARPDRKGWRIVPAAVKAEFAENIKFSNCSFQNLGGTGLLLGTACKNCVVENVVFEDISGNGIMIGEGQDRLVNGQPWWKSTPDQVAKGNTIQNCTVTECGSQFYGAVGIWCGLTAETKIRNNKVFNLPYSGISVGWMWSPEPTPCRANTIEGNHIHHIMNILSDGGGIYMLGLQPGSIIRNNHIHDVQINAGRAESNGMFLDEGITDVVVENNLVYNIAKSPLRFHKATKNLVKNNLFFCIDNNPPIRYNSTKEDDILKVDNKIFNVGEPEYKKELEKAIKYWKPCE